MAKPFFDTNVLLYLLSGDAAKADRAEELLGGGGVVSVQVLNEFAAVARRKAKMEWLDIQSTLKAVRAACRVLPVTLELHDEGISIAERYGFTIYDSLIVAAAITGDCETLYSEDLQDKQTIGQVTISNPFKGN